MNLFCVLPRSARHLQGENKYDCPLSSHDNGPVLCKISFMIKISDSIEEKVEDRLPTRAHTLEAGLELEGNSSSKVQQMFLP